VVDEQVQLLVIAGDLYDGDWRDYSNGLCFSTSKWRYCVRRACRWCGFAQPRRRQQLTAHLALPDNTRELSHKKPESFLLEALGVARAMVRASSAGTRRAILSEHYPEPKRDLFTSDFCTTALEGRPGHASYAPCRLSALVDRGYEYFALGHVHNEKY